MKNYIFFVTTPNLEEGKRIAQLLVERKIVACVNLIKGIYSIYRWKDKIEENEEVMLIIKTSEDKTDELINKINAIHSYEVPECVGIKIDKGSQSYLNWIDNIVSNKN
ncbi:MAG: divalent-cation tolerance protein CutA [Promethearchaeota archaeon]|nr:MAG: divalent-cation tolerance protein CutA [Candidatus Lokiarchaeota archaeon]